MALLRRLHSVPKHCCPENVPFRVLIKRRDGKQEMHFVRGCYRARSTLKKNNIISYLKKRGVIFFLLIGRKGQISHFSGEFGEQGLILYLTYVQIT